MTRAGKVIQFIEKYCVTPDGAHVGKPLVLADFQKEFIRAVYDNPAGTRRAYLSIARKNGKSGLIAGLLLAHLVGPEAVLNSQIVSGAMSRDQAALVFNLAAKMVQLSPKLAKIVRIVPSGKRLLGLNMNTEYRLLLLMARPPTAFPRSWLSLMKWARYAARSLTLLMRSRPVRAHTQTRCC